MLPFPINTAGNDVTPWISPDWPAPGSQLWFVSNRGDSFDIYVATWFPKPDSVFRRGDCNDDDAVELSDAVCTLNFLFLGGPAPGCLEVADVNGEDGVNIADPTYLLNFLFLGGPAPVAPFPDCGTVDGEVDCKTPPESCQ